MPGHQHPLYGSAKIKQKPRRYRWEYLLSAFPAVMENIPKL